MCQSGRLKSGWAFNLSSEDKNKINKKEWIERNAEIQEQSKKGNYNANSAVQHDQQKRENSYKINQESKLKRIHETMGISENNSIKVQITPKKLKN